MTQITNIPYKYRIHQILNTFNIRDNRRLRKEIREKLGLTFVTFSRRLYALKSDKLDFTGTELLEISKILNVPVEELYYTGVTSC